MERKGGGVQLVECISFVYLQIVDLMTGFMGRVEVFRFEPRGFGHDRAPLPPVSVEDGQSNKGILLNRADYCWQPGRLLRKEHTQFGHVKGW